MWLALALIVAGFVAFGVPRAEEEPVYCTQDAMQCPDGSYVGRTGPQCEFAPCPGMDVNTWQTFTDAGRGITFRYPERFPTTYIEVYDWPPQVQVTEGPFTCTEAGDEEGRAGRTEARMIKGRSFCVTEVVGAAAGSRYAQYAYAFESGGKVPILTFTVRAPECGNYAETPEMAKCEAERLAFNVDAIVDGMVSSFQFE